MRSIFKLHSSPLLHKPKTSYKHNIFLTHHTHQHLCICTYTHTQICGNAQKEYNGNEKVKWWRKKEDRIWKQLSITYHELILGRSVEKTNKQLIVETLYLDLEDLKQSKSDGEKMERQNVVLPSKRAYWVHQYPLELNPMFGPQCKAESRGVIKNLILVGILLCWLPWSDTRFAA